MEPEPVRPVTGQLEEVVEVHQPERLELGKQLAKRVGIAAVNRTDRDEIALDAKLVWCETKPSVDGGTSESARLVGSSAHEERGRATRYSHCHRLHSAVPRMYGTIYVRRDGA